MAEILYDAIPSLDPVDFTSNDPNRKSNFVKLLGEVYNNIDFVAKHTKLWGDISTGEFLNQRLLEIGLKK